MSRSVRFLVGLAVLAFWGWCIYYVQQHPSQNYNGRCFDSNEQAYIEGCK